MQSRGTGGRAQPAASRRRLAFLPRPLGFAAPSGGAPETAGGEAVGGAPITIESSCAPAATPAADGGGGDTDGPAAAAAAAAAAATDFAAAPPFFFRFLLAPIHVLSARTKGAAYQKRFWKGVL